ncbi:MAG: deoxyribonuclease IV [Candidatus Dojkabacteria bacterium]|nr:deoxyribonuclease IV [Candidatus Dojkabacteria bacterium]
MKTILPSNFGCYVSSSGGLFKILERSHELCIKTVMTHPVPPQKWNTKSFDEKVVKDFFSSPFYYPDINIFFHSIYLVNLATLNNKNYHLSKLSILNHLDLLLKIKGKSVVFHPGSFKDVINENDGFLRIANAINWVFSNLTIEPTPNCLLIECSAGSGRIVGAKIDDLMKIYELIDEKYKAYVGFCLDTQHLFASGYDLVNKLDEVVQEIKSKLINDKIVLIHLNDSKSSLGSCLDRHEDLGKGFIGINGLRRIINNYFFKNKFVVLETPSLGSLEGSRAELDTLLSILD